MAVQRDSTRNEDSDIRQMSDEALVRLVAQGRESEQPQEQHAAARAWEQLVVREYDRVRGLVVTFRWRGFENVRVDPNDYDDATQKAFERCLEKLGKGFLGTSVGEFKNAIATCVQFACMDHLREELRRDKGLAGSLDERLVDEQGDARGRFDADIARIEERIEAGRFDSRLELSDMAAAIDGLPNEQMRAVLRLKAEGYSSREIGDQLGLSVSNVDQLRSRGVRQLDGGGDADDR